MALNTHIDPYWDDYNQATSVDGLTPKEKYNQILFRPGVAIQARELTQLQSMLQNQVSSVGDHMFKNGSMVVPGGVEIYKEVRYVKLASLNGSATGSTTTLSSLIGLEITDSAGNYAKILHVEAGTTTDPVTLYLNHFAGNSTFSTTASLTGTSFAATVGNVIDNTDTTITGAGFLVSVSEGIYYIRKRFVITKAATVVVGKYSTAPTQDVGFHITEAIVTSSEDSSLNDNATGSPNAAAPGAHRVSIKTSLISQNPWDGVTSPTTAVDFVLLARVEAGDIVKQARVSDYSVFEDTLARRTFDESGNYAINPFVGRLVNDTSTHIALAIEPTKAYVQGYEVETYNKSQIAVRKGNSSTVVTDRSTTISHNSLIYITESGTSGGIGQTWAANEGLEGDLPVPGDIITLKNSGGTTIGTATLASIQNWVKGAGSVPNVFRLNVINVTPTVPANGFQGFSTGTITVNSTNFDVYQGWIATHGLVGYQFVEENLVFKLPNDVIKTLDSVTSGTSDYNHSYEVVREMDSTYNVASTTATWTLGADEAFTDVHTSSVPMLDWTLWSVDNDAAVDPGDWSGVLSASNKTVTITLGASVITAGTDVRLIAPVIKTGGNTGGHRSKTLTTPSAVLLPTIVSSANVDFTKYEGNALSTYADVQSLLTVEEYNTSTSLVVRTVTEYFELDNGQRDAIYDYGRIRIKSGSNYEVAHDANVSLRITFSYWAHSGSGDFFTVDSYDAGDYTSIGKFNGIELRDAVDFRQIVGTSTQLHPRSGSTFKTDVQHYLGRIDKVYFDSRGEFKILEGQDSLTPGSPDNPKEAMTVAVLTIPAYTFDAGDVHIQHLDNRRFTMRDISTMDRRINRMEYYTALNHLENQAANQQMWDNDTSTHAFKTGLIVDPFTNTKASRVDSPEFKAGIDRLNGLARPTFNEDNISLEYNNTNDGNSGVTQKYGGLVTLPYSQVAVISQQQASGSINVNPFSVFNWTGTLELTPSSDEWKETSRRPAVVIDDDSVYDALVSQLREENAMGTVWDSWETNWTGTEVKTTLASTPWEMHKHQTYRTTSKSRSGVETFIAPSTVLENHGDRVVEVNILPFMRSRLVTCVVTRCRPNTRLYPFFDGVAVDDYVSTTVAPTSVGGVDATVYAKNNSQYPGGSTTITTTSAGSVSFYFWVPDGLTSGTKELLLTEDQSNTGSEDVTITSASTMYTSKGILESVENVTVATRVPTIQKRNVSDNRSTRQLISTTWSDPLAQSFMIGLAGGCFITSLDLYFNSKDTTSIAAPVTVQIREMENGYPNQRVLPFGDVTVAASAVSTTAATRFTFPSPIHLQQDREYCFVILSNSNGYTVDFATVGERDSNDVVIQAQPYNGVMFKSANASTWTADQSSDLRFVLNRANFVKDLDHTLTLENGVVPQKGLKSDPFTTSSGSTAIVCFMPNHGLKVGDKVEIMGAAASNGIPATQINAEQTVTDIRIDTFTFSAEANSGTTVATSSGISGGTNVSADYNVVWNTAYPYVENMIMPGTNLTWNMVSTDPSTYNNTTAAGVVVNQNVNSNTPQVILSTRNAVNASLATPSMTLTGTMRTSVSHLTPLIDLDRCSVITIANRIDRPIGTATSGYNLVDNYFAETDPFRGSAQAKYVAKTVELKEESSELKIWMDIHRPTQTHISVYVKLGTNVNDIDENIDWYLLSPTVDSVLSTPNYGANIPFTDQEGEFNEIAYSISLASGQTVYPSGATPSNAQSSFSVFAVKVVFESENTSKVPLIKNFRAIAAI